VTTSFTVTLVVLPWYIHLPEILANWRVTGHWLNEKPAGFNAIVAFIALPWSYLSIHGPWGVSLWLDAVNGGLFVVFAVVAWRALSWRLFTPRRCLLWLWLFAAWLGPVVFDLLRGTYVMAVPRYALAGVPSAILLVGLGLSRLGTMPRLAFTALIVLAWSVGIHRIYVNDSRHYEPTRQLGLFLAEGTNHSDLVIVHSIPSGVAGIARYLQQSGRAEAGFASWVGQLKQRRVPEDLVGLATGFKRIVLVKIHTVGAPALEETWLRENAKLGTEFAFESATVAYFYPGHGDTFFQGDDLLKNDE
jgi:hypothetical protein